MDEAEVVLARLGRIDRLKLAGAPADAMLEELRELLREADEWSRLEGGDDARRRSDASRSRWRETFLPR